MRCSVRNALLFLSPLISLTSALTIAQPGTAADIIITSENTVNATAPSESSSLSRVRVRTASTASSGQLNLSFVNNLASDNVTAYVTGLDASGLLVMLQPNGQWFYPTATSSGVPQPITANVAVPLGIQGSTTNITLPGYISAGRVWFADGTLQFYTVQGASGASLVEPSAVNPSDPSAGVNWGFVELTNTAADGLYANISYVDFVGLPVGMNLTNIAGTVQSAYGVGSESVTDICDQLIQQTCQDGQPWDDLCVIDANGYALRVLSPTQYLSLNSSAFSNYWTAYINSVWTHYTTTPLTIDTQAAAGDVNCTVSTSTGLLTCAGDNRGYAKPTASDIFGCASGPFSIQSGDNAVHYAVVPRLCAAFHRATYLVAGGNIQPSLSSGSYYTVSPNNRYSQIVHEYEVDGKGYAFAYDDVTPDGATNESGLLATSNPALLTIIVGGPA